MLLAEPAIWHLGLVLLGLVAGVMTGLLGIGGGFIITPSLRIIFGIAYPVAVGSSLVQIMMATLFSTYGHWRRKNVDPKLGTLMAAGSLIGAEGGVRLLQVVTSFGLINIGGRTVQFVDFVMNGCFFVLMAGVAVFMLRESLLCQTAEPENALALRLRKWAAWPVVSFPYSGIERISVWVPVTISLTVGCFAGLLGIGGGFIGLPLMIYLIGLPTRLAVGTSTLQVFIASVYGALRHSQLGHTDYLLVFWLILGAMLGVKIGVKFCVRVNVRTTRKCFAILLVLAALMVAFQFFTGVTATLSQMCGAV